MALLFNWCRQSRAKHDLLFQNLCLSWLASPKLSRLWSLGNLSPWREQWRACFHWPGQLIELETGCVALYGSGNRGVKVQAKYHLDIQWKSHLCLLKCKPCLCWICWQFRRNCYLQLASLFPECLCCALVVAFCCWKHPKNGLSIHFLAFLCLISLFFC